MGGCCRWDWLVRKGDTKEEARIKTTIFPFAAGLLIFLVFSFFNALMTYRQYVSVIGICCVGFGSFVFLVGVLFNAVPPGYLLDAWLGLSVVGLCCIDLCQVTRSSSFRAW
eukprot:Hpha_TRINITY_DN16406_c3_g3::TRINITY_DN16406_c3_g3_i1::g.160168::m.160168